MKTGHIGILKQVDLLHLNGKKFKTILTSLDSLLEDSFVVKLIPPRDPFLLRFVGVDDRGDFARVSPNVVDPKLPGIIFSSLFLQWFSLSGLYQLPISCFSRLFGFPVSLVHCYKI